MSHPHLPVLFEALYDGERHVGFGRAEDGAQQTLYRVEDGQVAAAFISTDGSEEALRAALTEGAASVVVTAGTRGCGCCRRSFHGPRATPC